MGNKASSKKQPQCNEPDQLPPDELQLLKKSTQFSEAQIKQWHESFIEDCPHRKLSEAQFLQYYGQLYPAEWVHKVSQGDPAKFSNNIFKVFDTDQSGYIDFREFLLAVDLTSNGAPEDKIKSAFKIYDVDNTGKIPRVNMTHVIQAIFETCGCGKEDAKMAARVIYDKLDTDKDNCVTLDEFIKCCEEHENLYEILAL